VFQWKRFWIRSEVAGPEVLDALMLGFDEVGDGIDKLVAGVNDDLCWLKRVVVRVHHIRRR
jgi:hypothetical protein